MWQELDCGWLAVWQELDCDWLAVWQELDCGWLAVWQELDGILAVLAAILHITNVQFVEDPETDGVFIKNEELPAIGLTLFLALPLVIQCSDHLTCSPICDPLVLLALPFVIHFSYLLSHL